MNLKALSPHPNPAPDYAAAARRAEAWQAQDGRDINPVSRTQFFSHGQATPRAMVWFHGYTNSPAQFNRLGQACYERGDNVLIPRCPHHGLSDRMTPDTALLTAEELVRYVDEAVDIAAGLGQRVIVGGLSLGGVLAAWAAQQRSEVDTALLISPAFGISVAPAWMLPLLIRYYMLVPNQFRWWDDELKDELRPPYHAYARLATRGLAQTLRLGLGVLQAARQRKPHASCIWMVTNDNDHKIDLEMCKRLVSLWRARGAAAETFTFPAALKLGHDIIESTVPNQKIDVVYPELLRMSA